MCKEKYEAEIAARDGTCCFECGQFYEVMLLVPNEGNKRRFTRHYRCDSCERIIVRHDFGYLFLKLTKAIFDVTVIPWTITNPRPSRRVRPALAAATSAETVVEIQESDSDSLLSNWVKKTHFRAKPRPHIQDWTETMPAFGRAQLTMSANVV